MTRDEALARAEAALRDADLHAQVGPKSDLDRAQTWMDLADRLTGGHLNIHSARLTAACQQLLDACAAEAWEPDAVLDLLTQFFDAQGFDMSGRPA